MLASAVAWEQTRIVEVRIDAPGMGDTTAIERALGIKPGDVVSRREVRAGVRALVASRVVEDAEVDVLPGADGAVLIVRLQAASLVRRVEITGVSRRQAKVVRALIGIDSGSPLRVDPFVAGLGKVEAVIRQDGYPQARIEPTLRVEGPAVDVALAVTLGPPLVAAEVTATGAPLDARRLPEAVGLAAGETLSAAAIERARARLGTTLRRDGYWEAEVKPPVVSAGPTGTRIDFPVTAGAKYRLEVIGVTRSKLDNDAVPFVQGEPVFAASAVEQVATDVRTFYQRAGRLLAKAAAELVPDGAERVLRLTVEPGPKTPVRAVRFPGAEAVHEEVLRERIGARAGAARLFGGEPVDEQTLAADATSLLVTLREQGYAEARVAEPQIRRRPDGVEIDFPVELGARRVVTAVATEGVPAGVKVPDLGLAVGAPWSTGREEQARITLDTALREAGYAGARVTATHECENGGCGVRYRVEAGERTVLRRLVVAGLTHTRRSVVSELADLPLGSAAGPERQLEAQRRLLGLGVFQSVDIHPVPGLESEPTQNLVIDLREAASRAWSLGLSYDTQARLGVGASWSELNAFGTGRSVGVEALVSGSQRRAQLNFRAPAALGLWGKPAVLSFYRTEETFTGYTSLRRGTLFEVGDRLQKPLRVIGRYEYQIVDSTAADDTVLSREQRRAKINSLSPIVEWDTRDDFLNPTRGALVSLQIQSAFKFLMATAEFDRLTAQVAGFQPSSLGLFAGSVRAGWLHSRSSKVTVAPDPIDVPVAVRFFGGGRVSHRAFGTDMLGIPGKTIDANGNPIGGGGLLLVNGEWRVHLYGPVKGLAFVDGGNVWRRATEIALGELRWGGGIGLRFETPVGPLRLEYGWKFDRIHLTPTVREAPGQFFVAFGNPF